MISSVSHPWPWLRSLHFTSLPHPPKGMASLILKPTVGPWQKVRLDEFTKKKGRITWRLLLRRMRMFLHQLLTLTMNHDEQPDKYTFNSSVRPRPQLLLIFWFRRRRYRNNLLWICIISEVIISSTCRLIFIVFIYFFCSTESKKKKKNLLQNVSQLKSIESSKSS